MIIENKVNKQKSSKLRKKEKREQKSGLKIKKIKCRTFRRKTATLGNARNEKNYIDLNSDSSKHWTKQKQIRDLARYFIFHCLSPFNCCCLSVVLQLDKGDHPENSRVVFCPNKQRSLEPFMCLDPKPCMPEGVS